MISGDRVDDLDTPGPAVAGRFDPLQRLVVERHRVGAHLLSVSQHTHTSDPVPYLIVDSEHDGPGGTYTEPGVASEPVVVGHELIGRMLAG